MDDPLEREADRVADAVVDGRSTVPRPLSGVGMVQRKCATCAAEEEDSTVRLKRGSSRGGSTDAAVGSLGAGAPLPASERRFFEPRLGRDLSTVRVHPDAPGATAIGARAFAIARDVAFAPGEWRPGTVEGRRLLAHELVHVLQQAAGGEAVVRRQTPERDAPPLPVPLPMPRPSVVGGICGPDVTAETARVWRQIRNDFRGWPVRDQQRACRYLIQPLVRGGSGSGTGYGLNADAFDTIGLYQGSARYLRQPPYHPPCGTPGSSAPAPAPGTDCDADPGAPGCDFDPGHESRATCSNTVKVGSECWLSGTVNYGTYGIMMRLCFDAMPSPFDLAFSPSATRFFVQGYKVLKGDDPEPPWAWARAAWWRGAAATATGSNRPGCAPTCAVPFAGPSFDYVWEPVKPR